MRYYFQATCGTGAAVAACRASCSYTKRIGRRWRGNNKLNILPRTTTGTDSYPSTCLAAAAAASTAISGSSLTGSGDLYAAAGTAIKAIAARAAAVRAGTCACNTGARAARDPGYRRASAVDAADTASTARRTGPAAARAAMDDGPRPERSVAACAAATCLTAAAAAASNHADV